MRRNDGLFEFGKTSPNTRADVRHPVNTSYRGYELLTCPVTAGTITTLQTLNILENFDLDRLTHNSSEHLHLFIEAARHAFAARYSFAGDPEFVPVPFEGILAKDYARHISSSIDTDTANLEHERELQPWVAYTDNPLHDPWSYKPATAARSSVVNIAT